MSHPAPVHGWPSDARLPERPSADPWWIVHIVLHDLSRAGIKDRFGPEAHLGAAATAAAALLEALGVEAVIEREDT